MRSLKQIQAILVFQLLCFSVAVKAVDSTAPMEKKEQEALYSAIQGFVGKSWNGSELYPDPCGWTPIQVNFLLTQFGFLGLRFKLGALAPWNLPCNIRVENYCLLGLLKCSTC